MNKRRAEYGKSFPTDFTFPRLFLLPPLNAVAVSSG